MFSRYLKNFSKGRLEKIRHRLAMVYALIAWNGAGFCIYVLLKDKEEKSGIPSKYNVLVSKSSDQTSRIIRLEGFNVVENAEYDKEEIVAMCHQLQNSPETTEDI